AGLRSRVHHRMFDGRARGRGGDADLRRGAGNGCRGAHPGLRRRRDRRPRVTGGRARGRADRGRDPHPRHPVLRRDRADGPVSDRRDRPLRPARGSLRTRMTLPGPAGSAAQGLLTPRRVVPVTLGLLVLLVLPLVLPPFETLQVSYGLIFGIAALGFNLLLGYTGLLSFGHSAFFGTGAYAAAFLVKYGGIRSM